MDTGQHAPSLSFAQAYPAQHHDAKEVLDPSLLNRGTSWKWDPHLFLLFSHFWGHAGINWRENSEKGENEINKSKMIWLSFSMEIFSLWAEIYFFFTKIHKFSFLNFNKFLIWNSLRLWVNSQIFERTERSETVVRDQWDHPSSQKKNGDGSEDVQKGRGEIPGDSGEGKRRSQWHAVSLFLFLQSLQMTTFWQHARH